MTAQQRLERIQLVNWGTFNGSFTLPVPRDGLLITGPSGSGKSSLLDALAAVLVQPKWLMFNAAAQEGGVSDRNRSLISYVRGAFKREADDATGEVSTAYLRTGATWSGIALTFDDGTGAGTSVIRLLHLPRGSNAADALSSLFVIADGGIDLLALAPFVENGLNIRQLRAAHPGWFTFQTYAGFASKLQRRLGIGSDQAQRLLHKTQSAKNLTSLDVLLRDFMLDEPDTFTLANEAVTQFQELSQAHASVVDARRQVEVLGPLRGIDAELNELRQRSDALLAQETHLRTVVVQLRAESATADLAAGERRVDALTHEQNRADAAVRDCAEARERARSAVDGLGGREVRDLERTIEQYRVAEASVAHRRERWTGRCRQLGVPLPDSADGYVQFRERAEATRADLDESDQGRDQRYQLAARAAEAGTQVNALRGQLDALSRQKSNLDERLLLVRQLLLESAEVPRQRLPFVGELIDVLPDQARWQGAIERVLRPFARTLLVPDDLYPYVSAFVEGRHLGTRLVYEKLPAEPVASMQVGDSRSLVSKLTVADAEASGWVRAELARRFDYRCVETVAELRGISRGVTLAGQVKHSISRHEKDDRSRIDDRSTWVLGTSTDAKRRLLESAIGTAEETRSRTAQLRDDADRDRDDRLQRAGDLTRLLELTWTELDLDTPRSAVQRLSHELKQLLAGGTELAAARVSLQQADRALGTAQTRRDEIVGQLSQARAAVQSLQRDLAEWQRELAESATPPAPVREALVARLNTLDASLEKSQVLAQQQLAKEREDALRLRSRAVARAERIMQTFKTDWPIPAQDWAIAVDFLADYLGRLELLQADRLPEFEDRFFTLLQTQSQNNIGILSTRLRNARREVRERIDPINASLRLTEYAPGRHLHVRVDDRRNPEVTDFLQNLSLIAGGTLGETLGAEAGDTARVRAEQRFDRMQALLNRLASSDPSDVRWRQHCLDTRQHVKFLAEVRDEAGQAVDYFAGAGGLSGGERQKLVIFCLAAALRYQLARDGAVTPSYGLVVLDEAFDKTDPAFTKAGLEVFHTFGFQLLLATPLKMLQTLEDYVGGAAVVLNDSARGSRLEFLDFHAGERVNEPLAEPAGEAQAALL